jgi:hypothetical protein
VLDTWFSSGLWPFSTLGWPNTDTDDFKTFYPTQVCAARADMQSCVFALFFVQGRAAEIDRAFVFCGCKGDPTCTHSHTVLSPPQA